MSTHPQLEAAYNFCQALNTHDTTALGSLLSDDHFSFRLSPASIGPEAGRIHDKAELLALAKGVFEHAMNGTNIALPPVEEVQGTDKVVLLLDDVGTKVSGEPYRLEYILFFSFAPGTDKISSAMFYHDSIAVVKQFEGWYQKSMQAAGALHGAV